MTIKRNILYATNGIMIQDPIGGFSDVVQYRKRNQNGSNDTTPAKTAIGGEIFDLALECVGEGVPDGEDLIGFSMEVTLTPITKKKGV